MAKEGNGEFKVKVTAKERRLDKRKGLGLLELFGISSLENVAVVVCLELEREGNGGRSRPIRVMVMVVTFCLSFHHCSHILGS